MTLVGIIGGAGAMGSYFAELFANERYNVLISDINVRKGEDLARENRYEFIHPDKLESSGIKFDVLMFSILPIPETYSQIERFAHMVKDGGLLTDVTSVKINPVVYMLANSREEVAVIGMHPMFRPDLSLEGQRVILTPMRDNKNLWQQRLEDIITKNKGVVKITSPENHDYIMGIIQGLTHSVSMISLRTLEAVGADLNELMEYSSPVYRTFFDLMTRTTSGQARLYRDIQFENPTITRIFTAFYASYMAHRQTVESRDERGFEGVYDSLKQFVSTYAAEAAKNVARFAGTPRGAELFFEQESEARLREVVDGKTELYKRIKKDNGDGRILTMIVDPGHVSHLYKKFSMAQYTQWHDRLKEPSTVAFFVRNVRHPLERGKMIRFSPINTVTPEKEHQRFPKYRKEQLINYYADPIQNLFDTVSNIEHLRQLPPFVVYRTRI